MLFRSSLARLLAVAIPSALLFATAGCVQGGEPDAGEEIGIYGQPIKGGYESPGDTSVVGIYDASIGAECSGSLIAPNVVLTARHCVSNTAETVQCGSAKPGGLHKASDFFVTTRPYFTQNAGDYHEVREVVGLPLDVNSADPLLNKEDLCGRDMAILILASNIDPIEAKPLVPRVDSSLVEAEQYYAIGFGATNDNGGGAGVRRRRDNLFVDCVSDACPSSQVKASEFVGDTGICQGDSGGPALDMQNRVVGVTSRGSFGCDSPVYGHVFGWGQWMKDVVNYAAQPSMGNYPAPGWAAGRSTDPAYAGLVGAECDTPECVSGLCLNNHTELGNYCTAKCDAVNTCPDGFECDAKLGLCKDKPDPKPETKPEDDPEAKGGCALAPPDDPTKPVPWKMGALALVGAALALRRRRSR